MSTADLFKQEITQGKPLFQLQIDTDQIQQIFQKLISQIRIQHQEIEKLKQEITQKSNIDELNELITQVKELRNDCNNSRALIHDNTQLVKTILDERNKAMDQEIQKKVNDMMMTLNAAIKREMEDISNKPATEKKTFDEVHTMKLNMSKVTQKVEDIKNTVIQMAAAYDGKLKVEQLSRKTVPSCVRLAAEKDRRQLDENKKAIEDIQKKLEDFSLTFDRILPYANNEFPQFLKGYIYSREEKPTFPVPPYIHSFHDFALYTTQVIPMMQTMIREIHTNVKDLESDTKEKLSHKQFNAFKGDIDKTIVLLKEETDDYSKRKNNLVLKDDFNELADTIWGIVNGNSNSSCTNTRCICCGKIVQRTTGTIKVQRTTEAPLSSRTTERPMSARPVDLLRSDGLQPQSLFSTANVQNMGYQKKGKVTGRKL